MIWVVIILCIALGLAIKRKSVIDDKETLETAKRYYEAVESDLGAAVKIVSIDVDFLSTLEQPRDIRSQKTPGVGVKNNQPVYIFEIALKNRRSLDRDDLNDFKERLQRALNSIRQKRDNKCPFALIVTEVKEHSNYLEIVVGPQSRNK